MRQGLQRIRKGRAVFLAGMFVFPACTDVTPPTTISDLAITARTDSSVSLTWTAPGDGWREAVSVVSYDIRYSTQPITEASWDQAMMVSDVPIPGLPGTTETTTERVSPAPHYYFAVRTSDDVPNWSSASNVASAESRVISGFLSAIADKDLPRMDELLDAAFEFYPLEGELPEFPWLAGNSWDRTTELAMWANRFDENFVGDEPPVAQITVLPLLASQTDGSGDVTLSYLWSAEVLVGPDTGWVVDTMLEFNVPITKPGVAGNIREIRELTVTGVRRRDLEVASWGSVRALYR